MALLVDDLLVLLLNQETGRPLLTNRFGWSPVLAGALLWELATEGRVGPAGPGDNARPGSILVRRGDWPPDWLLARAQEQITRCQGSQPYDVIEKLSKDLPGVMVDRLERAGWLRKQENKKLGMVISTLYFCVYPEYQQGLRRACWSTLVDGQPPDPRATALISLAHAVDCAADVCAGANPEVVTSRAAQIASGDLWVGPAIRKATHNAEASDAIGRRQGRRR